MFNHLKQKYSSESMCSFIPYQARIGTGVQAVCISETMSRVHVLKSALEFRLRTVVVWCIHLELFDLLWSLSGLKGAS